MNIEVMAAGISANELRDDGDGGGEENERGAGEAMRVVLCLFFLFFHGSSRSVCVVCAATAAGVNGSAKVVPLYQSFHWSRK